MQWLKQHNDVMGIAIRDLLEVELRPTESLLMSDGEHQVQLGRDYTEQLVRYNQEHNQKSAR
ncbi:hypothetical protein [Vibrio variabilis]|uniref:hypothetical protein n=1 Tax=Vibrio variabilis TaxID=990271 RepID=UPI0013A6D725|nr:hypothetical protein [Vibrio variabilis]